MFSAFCFTALLRLRRGGDGAAARKARRRRADNASDAHPDSGDSERWLMVLISSNSFCVRPPSSGTGAACVANSYARAVIASIPAPVESRRRFNILKADPTGEFSRTPP